MAKLQCPECKSEDVRIYSMRSYPDKINRYRECNKCKHRFKTVEQIKSGWDYEAAINKIKKIVDKF